MIKNTFISLFLLVFVSQSGFSQKISLSEEIYDLKRADVEGLKFLRKRERLREVIEKSKNLKQVIASKEIKDGVGRKTASVIDEMSQKQWEDEIDKLLEKNTIE